jgi:hypothetical protein
MIKKYSAFMSKNYPTFRLRQVARSLVFVLAIIFVMSGTTSRAAAPAFVRHVVNINICSSTTTISIDSALAFTDADGGSDTISVPVGPYLVSGAGATGSVSASQVVLATAGLNNPAGTFGGYATSAYGVRSFTVKISDGTGSDTVRINVHILQQPFTPSISGPYTQLHINDQQLFTGTDYLAASDVARIGAYTTAWSVSGGGVATISNGSAVNEQLARGLALGSATLTYTLSNMCGSSSTTLSFI